jgi:hypothetical protein
MNWSSLVMIEMSVMNFQRLVCVALARWRCVAFGDLLCTCRDGHSRQHMRCVSIPCGPKAAAHSNHLSLQPLASSDESPKEGFRRIGIAIIQKQKQPIRCQILYLILKLCNLYQLKHRIQEFSLNPAVSSAARLRWQEAVRETSPPDLHRLSMYPDCLQELPN